jgi:hypothetical protein
LKNKKIAVPRYKNSKKVKKYKRIARKLKNKRIAVPKYKTEIE